MKINKEYASKADVNKSIFTKGKTVEGIYETLEEALDAINQNPNDRQNISNYYLPRQMLSLLNLWEDSESYFLKKAKERQFDKIEFEKFVEALRWKH